LFIFEGTSHALVTACLRPAAASMRTSPMRPLHGTNRGG
jgi:hypothetical protein